MSLYNLQINNNGQVAISLFDGADVFIDNHYVKFVFVRIKFLGGGIIQQPVNFIFKNCIIFDDGVSNVLNTLKNTLEVYKEAGLLKKFSVSEFNCMRISK